RSAHDGPDAVVGDAGRLRKVLTNLVGNSNKISAEGEVVVNVGLQSERQSETGELSSSDNLQSAIGNLQFEVTDTGIGIPRDKQQKIFEAFEQADTSTTRRYGGTGPGPSVAPPRGGRRGGRITVESEPGRGSIFDFTVQLHRPSAHPESAPAPVPRELQGVRVLVVDETATTRRTFQEWLRGWGAEPLAVADLSAALEAIRQAAGAGRPFSLVMLDSRLVATKAHDVALFRQMPALTSGAILLLEVDDQASEPGRDHDLDFAARVMKPVVEEDFLDSVCYALSLPSPLVTTESQSTLATQPGTRAPSVPSSGRRFRVLLAEDNPYNQALMQDLL